MTRVKSQSALLQDTSQSGRLGGETLCKYQMYSDVCGPSASLLRAFSLSLLSSLEDGGSALLRFLQQRRRSRLSLQHKEQQKDKVMIHEESCFKDAPVKERGMHSRLS